jgi:hypothetical protein
MAGGTGRLDPLPAAPGVQPSALPEPSADTDPRDRRRRLRTALGLTGALLLGAILRIALLPLPGSPDVGSWKAWSFAAATDVTSIYGVGGNPPERRLIQWRGIKSTTEYPPLALYELAVVGRLYSAINPAYPDSAVLTSLVKSPGIVAELALVIALLTWGRRVLGDAVAIWVAVAIWLNPAIILNGAALGYLDAQMAVPALLALVAAGAGLPALAGALTAVAVLTKAQALFIAPVVLFAAIDIKFRLARDADASKPPPKPVFVLGWFLIGGALAGAAIVLPIAVRGAWPSMVQAISRLAAHDMLSGNALNAWWLVTWVVRAAYALHLGWFAAFTMPVRILGRSRFMEIGYPDPKLIGTAIVALLIGWRLWRTRDGLPLAGWAATAGWCVFAYFMFGAQVHENHLYLAVPFFALAAGLDRRLRPLFYALSAIVAINMYVFYGLSEGWPPLVNRAWTVVDLTVVLSVINLGVFFWVTAETTGPPPNARNWDVEED